MGPAWGVALTFLREVTRSHGFRLFVPILVLTAFFVPRVARGPELLSELRVLASYGLGLPAVIIAVSTLAFAATSLGRDIEQRHIHLVATKPIGRTAILAGKWAGACVLSASLLVLVIAVFYLNLALLGVDTRPAEQQERAAHRFFSSRSVFPMVLPEADETQVARAIDEAIARERERSAELESHGSHEEPGHPEHAHGHGAGSREREQVDAVEIERRVRRRFATRSIQPGDEVALEFRGLRAIARDGERLQIRIRVTMFPPDALEVPATISGLGGFRSSRSVESSTWHEIDVPPSVVGDDGVAIISLRNAAAGGGARLILPPDGAELLQAYGCFDANLARSALALLVQFGFLAAIGLFGATCFTSPTAILFACLVYLLGLGSSFLVEIVGDYYSGAGVGHVVATSLETLLGLIPDFGAESPVRSIADGRALEMGVLAELGARTLFVRTGLVLGAGALIWRRRELGGVAA